MNHDFRKPTVSVISQPLLQTTALGRLCIRGKVYGKFGVPNGDPITTSPVTHITDEDTIITQNGSHYRFAVGSTDSEFEYRTKAIEAIRRHLGKV